MYHYCYAHIYFENKEFDTALNNLTKIKHDYFALKIDVKLLQLKIYYELSMYEQIYNQIDSFKHFITNHELLLPARRNKIKDFIMYYERVLKAKFKDDKESAGYLTEGLNKKTDKQFFKWLLQKAEELKR